MTSQSFSLGVASLLATAVVVGVGLVAALLQVSSGAAKAATFSPYVDETGKISLPAGYRSQWAHLGTWSVREMMGGLEYHGKAGCNTCHLDGRRSTQEGGTDTSAAANVEPLVTCFGYANLGLPLNPRDAFY